jgi:hypothetical protein
MQRQRGSGCLQGGEVRPPQRRRGAVTGVIVGCFRRLGALY